MKKYRITSIPQLSRGGGPGDEILTFGGATYKRTSSGEWYYLDSNNEWVYRGSIDMPRNWDNGITPGQELEKNFRKYRSSFGSTTQEAEKKKQEAEKKKAEKTASILSNPLLTTEQKIKAIPKTPTIQNAQLHNNLYKQKEKEDAAKALEGERLRQEQAKKQKEIELRASNPNFYNSETVQNVAAKTVPQTDQDWENIRQSRLMYDNKRYFLSQEALAENYDDIAYRVAQDLQSKNPKLSFEEALEEAKNNSDLLNEKAYEYVSQDPEVVSRIANQKGYSQPVREHSVKAWDPNDPNHIELSGRMPETVGEYFQRGADILFNPLDAIYYGMNPIEEMPINMYEYEKAKQQLGYEDGSDRAAMMTAIDFASWFHPVGAFAQATKMLRPTGEAVYNAIENPSWETAGNAAFNVGMNALAFTGTKIPAKSAFAMPRASFVGYAKTPQLKYLTNSREFAFGNPYLEEAKTILNLPGFKLATGKPPLYRSYPTVSNASTYGASGFAKSATSTAVGLIENASNSLLSTVSEPHVVTQSPLTTITSALPKKQPLDLDAALAADELNAFPGVPEAYRYNMEKNKNVGEILDQIKNERVEQLLTREGRARVEALIAENPHMQDLTYEDVVNGMRNIINDNAKLTSIENEILAVSDELDRLSQAPYLYAEEIQGLKDKLDDLNAEADIIEMQIEQKGSNAMMKNEGRNTSSQAIDISKVDATFMKDLYRASPDEQYKMFAGLGLSPADLRRVVPHELTHYLQRGRITNLDKELSKLKLRSGNFDIDNNLFAGESGVSEFWKRVMDIDRAGGTPFEKIRKYWRTGGKGQEKLAHVDELRADMLERGIMKEFYEEVTPEMIEKHYKQYMSEVGNKYPLRVYEIMEADKSNFNLLAGVINRMPAVVGAAATAASYLSDEDSDVSQAGILGALAMFSKKPGRLPVKALNVGKQILKKGYKGLNASSKKIADQFFKPEIREVFAKPEILRNPEAVKEAAKVSQGPTLSIKSTMAGSPLEKQLSKTGDINVNNLKTHISKSDVGQQDKFIIQKVLNEKFPGQTKINYNEFKKAVSEELVPLKRTLVPDFKYKDWGIFSLYGPGYKTPLENIAITYSNRNSFGRGSADHFSDDTLGHARTLVTQQEPDIMHFLEEQSDFFQKYTLKSIDLEKGKNILKRQEENYNKSLQILEDLKRTGKDFQGNPVDDYQIRQYEQMVVNDMGRKLKLRKAEYDNYEQKQFLAKTYLDRLLQENILYAAEQGKSKVRFPTSETAAKIQGYTKQTKLPDELQMFYAEEMDKLRAQGYSYNSAPYKKLMDEYDTTLKRIINQYAPEHQTILKKYNDYPKRIKKLFGVEPKMVTDSKGNTWYEMSIPKSYKEGTPEIKALGLIPYIAAGAAGADLILNDDTDDSVAQAGMLTILGAFAKKPGRTILSKQAIKAGKKLIEKGYHALKPETQSIINKFFSKDVQSMTPEEFAILTEEGGLHITPNKFSLDKTKDSSIVRTPTGDKTYTPTIKLTESVSPNTVKHWAGDELNAHHLKEPVLKYDTNTKSMQLTDAKPISTEEYVNMFNENLDKLNELIAEKNKSGIQYIVTGLTQSGSLRFETLPGQGLKEGTQVWRVNINPALWDGTVQDIVNKEYYKAIPGLEMSSSSMSVFSDGQARRGTNTYAAINEYLKLLGMGRVKPGFNYQTPSAEQAWKSYIKGNKAYGYYANSGEYDDKTTSIIYGTFKKQGGPIDHSMEIEIPEEEIADYVKRGYIVERL